MLCIQADVDKAKNYPSDAWLVVADEADRMGLKADELIRIARETLLEIATTPEV